MYEYNATTETCCRSQPDLYEYQWRTTNLAYDLKIVAIVKVII